MKIIKVHAECHICDFEIKYPVDTNEHGFFAIPDAYCPKCFCLLIQTFDAKSVREI